VIHPSWNGPRLNVEQGDLGDPAHIAKAVDGADAVVSAYGPPMEATQELVEKVPRRPGESPQPPGQPTAADVERGKLELLLACQLIDSGKLPEAGCHRKAHRDSLGILKTSRSMDLS